MKATVVHHKDRSGTIGMKGKGMVKKVTVKEVCDWVDKNIEIPIFTAEGINQWKKWQAKKKEWKINE